VATVLIPIPSKDFDPTEVAVSWKVLKRLGHSVVFATPAGREGSADDIMLTGEGLDLWGFLPGLRRLVAFGRMARANADARRAYTEMRLDPAFKAPLAWRQLGVEGFDGLLLPGGHRARGMREYLESNVLQTLVAQFFEAGLPVAAICHGVLLAARSGVADGGRSVLAAGPPRSLGRLNARAGRSGASFASGTRITTAHMLMDPETLPVSCRCKVRSHAHWPGLKTSSTFPHMLSTVIAE
jgi:putative intracellular protease/amidase